MSCLNLSVIWWLCCVSVIVFGDDVMMCNCISYGMSLEWERLSIGLICRWL